MGELVDSKGEKHTFHAVADRFMSPHIALASLLKVLAAAAPNMTLYSYQHIPVTDVSEETAVEMLKEARPAEMRFVL
jgi:hypothetical protein